MTTTKRLAALFLALFIAAAPFATFANDENKMGDDNSKGDQGHERGFLDPSQKEIFHGPAVKDAKSLFRGHDGNDKNDDKNVNDNNGKGLMVRADGSLTARIDGLTSLKARIESNDRLSAGDKADLTAAIDAQISFLQDLKAKLADGTKSAADIKAEFKSALLDWKGKALAMPKAAITAASDRILAIADKMDDLGDKLDARISEARDAGKDVSASVDARADFSAKVSDARADANAALSLVAQISLTTNDTDQIKANRQKLVDARAKIEDARKALKAARADVKTIADDLDISLSADLGTK
jgi:hypothetical protein